MYLSCLDLDPRPGRRGVQLWLANPYRIHQRICLAFDGPGRVLFRHDERPRPRLLVQSPGRPDWDRAFADFSEVLAGPPRFKELTPCLYDGQLLRFLLRANPTVKRDGHRHGLAREEEQRAWLDRKGRDNGFTPRSVRVGGTAVQISRRSPRRSRDVQSHLAVDFEGVLHIDDAVKFAEALQRGIGTAKAYGFGLMSIAPP